MDERSSSSSDGLLRQFTRANDLATQIKSDVHGQGNVDCLFGGHSRKFNGIVDDPDRCASGLFAYSNEYIGMFLLNTIRYTSTSLPFNRWPQQNWNWFLCDKIVLLNDSALLKLREKKDLITENYASIWSHMV